MLFLKLRRSPDVCIVSLSRDQLPQAALAPNPASRSKCTFTRPRTLLLWNRNRKRHGTGLVKTLKSRCLCLGKKCWEDFPQQTCIIRDWTLWILFPEKTAGGRRESERKRERTSESCCPMHVPNSSGTRHHGGDSRASPGGVPPGRTRDSATRAGLAPLCGR